MAVDFAMNGMVHRALLRELDRIQDLVLAGDIDMARRRYAFFSQILHSHHESEDAYLFPVVRERSTDPAELTTLDSLVAEHEQMHATLDRCDADFDSEGPLPSSTVSDLKGLRIVVAAHCAHEETEGEPLLAKYVTEADMKPFSEANRRSRHAMLVFPWIADGGSTQDQQVYNVLPGPLRLILRPIMTNKYKAYFR